MFFSNYIVRGFTLYSIRPHTIQYPRWWNVRLCTDVCTYRWKTMQRYGTGEAEISARLRIVPHGSEKFWFVRFFLINKNAETQRRRDFLLSIENFLSAQRFGWIKKRRGAEIPFFFENAEFTEFLCLMSHPWCLQTNSLNTSRSLVFSFIKKNSTSPRLCV